MLATTADPQVPGDRRRGARDAGERGRAGHRPRGSRGPRARRGRSGEPAGGVPVVSTVLVGRFSRVESIFEAYLWRLGCSQDNAV